MIRSRANREENDSDQKPNDVGIEDREKNDEENKKVNQEKTITKNLKVEHLFPSASEFDVICVQESWFDLNINSTELIASAKYNIVRKDRRDFMNSMKRGGDVFR